MQTALSRPEMAKPTSQVQRVEPRRWVQWDGRTEEAAVRGGGGGAAGEEGAGLGEELEAAGPPDTLKPGRGSGREFRSSERRRLLGQPSLTSLTSALGLPAAPAQRLQTLPGARANQLVAGLAQEVDLVADTKHPAQAAAEGRRLRFGAGG